MAQTVTEDACALTGIPPARLCWLPCCQKHCKTLRGQIDKCAAAAGSCIAIKPLADHFEPVKSCPECREPIRGLRRYGRIINKASIDLLDRKFATSNRLELQHAEDQMALVFEKHAEQAARDGNLTEDALYPMYATFKRIIQQSKRSPSAQVSTQASIRQICKIFRTESILGLS